MFSARRTLCCVFTVSTQCSVHLYWCYSEGNFRWSQYVILYPRRVCDPQKYLFITDDYRVGILLRHMAMICELLRTNIILSTLFVSDEKKNNNENKNKSIPITPYTYIVTVYVLLCEGFKVSQSFLSFLVLCHELILNIYCA